MSGLIVHIDSKRVRIERGEKKKGRDLPPYEHALAEVLKTQMPTTSDELTALLSGPAMQSFRKGLYTKLGEALAEFGAGQLYTEATGRLPLLNRTRPGAFSCAVYQERTNEDCPSVLPLIAHFSEDETPYTRYASVIESALLSDESLTQKFVQRKTLNILCLRSSKTSLIQTGGKLLLSDGSMPIELGFQIEISGADGNLKALGRFDDVVEMYISNPIVGNLSAKMSNKETVIIGKSARDLYELRSGIRFQGGKHAPVEQEVTFSVNDIEKMFAKALKRWGDSKDSDTIKKLNRCINTLALLKALCARKDTPLRTFILSDVTFSLGLTNNVRSSKGSFHKTSATLGIAPFFETFGLPVAGYAESPTPKELKPLPKEERFILTMADNLEIIQKRIQSMNFDLSAADLLRANSYQAVSQGLIDAITKQFKLRK